MVDLSAFFFPLPYFNAEEYEEEGNKNLWNVIYLSLILGPAFCLSVFHPSLWRLPLKVIWNTWSVNQSETVTSQVGAVMCRAFTLRWNAVYEPQGMVVKLGANLSVNSECFRAGTGAEPTQHVIGEILPFSFWQHARIEFKFWNWKEEWVAQLLRSTQQGTAKDGKGKAENQLAKMKFLNALLAGKRWFDKLWETECRSGKMEHEKPFSPELFQLL